MNIIMFKSCFEVKEKKLDKLFQSDAFLIFVKVQALLYKYKYLLCITFKLFSVITIVFVIFLKV